MADNNSGITRRFAIDRHKALEWRSKDTLTFMCIILNMYNGIYIYIYEYIICFYLMRYKCNKIM